MTHPDVSTVVAAYLAAVDAAQPGLVTALYIGGSVPLGDFRPHESDIDFFAITSRPPDTEALTAVHTTLGRTHPRPHFDGLYLTWDELAAGPLAHPSGPHVSQHRFAPTGGFERNPVSWHILAAHGITVRGPALSEIPVWTDDAALRDYCRRNLDEYWRPQPTTIRDALTAGQTIDEPTMRFAAAYCALGVPRLHYTLATGDITTKADAGKYARKLWPNWTPVIDECLRFRAAQPPSPTYPDPTPLLSGALDFAESVAADARSLHPSPT